MPRFAFKAIGRGGMAVAGEIDALSRAHALDLLSSNGQTPVYLAEAGQYRLRGAQRLDIFRQKSAEFLTFAQELSSLLGAGLTVERALGVLRALATDRRRVLRVSQVLESVRAGTPLSRALRIVIPSGSAHFEHLIAAGEASGQLPEVMARLAQLLTRSKTLRDRLVSSLTYPALLVLTMQGVLWIVFTSVLPRLAPMFSGSRAVLPVATEGLLIISKFFQAYGWSLLLGLCLCGVAAFYVYRRTGVRLALHRFLLNSRLLLEIPKNYEAATFCRNLETLLGGGQPLDRALRAARLSAANNWFQDRLSTVSESVEGGGRLAAALANAGVFPPLVVELAAVGEETGKLAQMMGDAAAVLERDVETRLDRLTALVLPVATLIMGALVAGVMFGIVTGLLAVNDLAS